MSPSFSPESSAAALSSVASSAPAGRCPCTVFSDSIFGGRTEEMNLGANCEPTCSLPLKIPPGVKIVARGEGHARHLAHLLQQRGGERRRRGVRLLGDRLARGDDDRGPLQRVAEDLVERLVDRVGEDVGPGDQRDADQHREHRAERARLARPEALDREASQAASSARSPRRRCRARRRRRCARRAG